MGELQVKSYGAVDARDYIPGAEALQLDPENEEEGSGDEKDEKCDENDDEGDWVDVSHSEDEWINVSHSDDEVESGSDDEDGEEEEDEEADSDDEEGEDEEGGEDVSQGSGEDEDEDEDEDESGTEGDSESSDDEEQRPFKRRLTKYEKKKQKRMRKDLKMMQKKTDASEGVSTSVVEERKQKAAAVSLSRILTDKDFSRIDAAQVKKQMEVAKARKRNAAHIDDTDTVLKR
jgi:protein SDA1